MLENGEEREPLAVGVIGCGYWGSNYVRNFEDCFGSRVVAAADERQDRLDAVQSRHPSVRVVRDVEALLGDPEVEAIAIATPVFTHYDLGRAALEAGKHVVLAKPMTVTCSEAEALTDLAQRLGLTLLIDHTYLYGAPVRKIRELLERGDLGEPYTFDSVRVNLGPFRSDVNVIWDLAAHDVSIVTYLFDAEPRFVHAVGASHSPSGIEDVAYVTLSYAGDLLAHCHVNWLSPVKIRQTLVAGSEKMLVWNDLAVDEQIRVYDYGVTTTGDGEDLYQVLPDYRMGDIWTPRLDGSEALATMVEHFVDCVRQGETPMTDGDFGVRVMRLLESAAVSLRDGGRPVEVSSLPTH
jgi:predicted dehydrogenase